MTYTVTIFGAGHSSMCYVIIGGTKYYNPTTLTVEAGTEITCGARGSPGTTPIVENGVAVGSGTQGTTYTFAVVADTEIELYTNGAYSNTINITYKKAPADPMAPHDGHNTNIDNTAYQLESGTVLLNGVACEIELGTTLVGGVAYEIPFIKPVCVVKITNSGNASRCYVTINGTNYSAANTLEVEQGTEIQFYVTNTYSSSDATISLNGTTVASGRPAQYTHTVTGDVTITFFYNNYDVSTIYITET